MKYEKDLQKTMNFLKELAIELGFGEDKPAKQKADRILRSVLYAIRKRVVPSEYLEFISQLPICIKAEAVNGWDLDKSPDKSIKHLDDFIEAAISADRNTAAKDFEDKEKAKEIIKKVFNFLKAHTSEGEIKDLAAQMPEEIKEFILQA
jgi:uncharacterized protein (DUF2267 family)